MIEHKTQNYTIRIDEERGEIVSLTDGGKEFVSKTAPLFRICMRDQAGACTYLDTYEMQCKEAEQTDDQYRITYTHESCTVKVTVNMAEDIEWCLAIENHSDLVMEWTDFPQIFVPKDLIGDGGKSRVLWGFNEGVVVEDMSCRDRRFSYNPPAYPGEGTMGMFPAIVQTQCMAYYDGKHGLYMSANDNAANIKGIDFFEDGGAIALQYRHFSGADFGEDFMISYPTVMQMFAGDWYDAAEIYRSWFEENRLPEFLPITENPDLPEWYEDSPIIVTYPVRGIHDMDEMKPNKLFPYCNAMKHIRKFAEKTDSRIMALLMHWEGTAPWAPPYVWPPYGGEEVFEEFAKALHEEGHLLGVYCSGIGWTQQSNLVAEYNMEKKFEEENLARFMCTSPEGTLPHSHICTGQRSGYDLCPSCDFTVDTVENEVRSIVGSGVDYIQVLDQNHGGTSYFCYSREHGHPPVPGKWQTDAMKKLLAKLKKHTAPKKVLLGCESAAAESYIPDLLFSDNRYNLCYAIGKPVPLYGYLYHSYLNNFMGNQVCTHEWLDHHKYPDSLYLRMAHAFIAGDMLTFIIDQDGNVTWNWGNHDNSTLPDQQKVIAFADVLNRARRLFKKYLHTGQMQKPVEVLCNTQKIPHADKYVDEYPVLLTSSWLAEDGMCGQFIVNYNCTPHSATLRFDTEREVTVTNGSRVTESVTKELSLEIAPLDVVSVEWKAE